MSAYTDPKKPDACLQCGRRAPREHLPWAVLCMKCVRGVGHKFKMVARSRTGTLDSVRQHRYAQEEREAFHAIRMARARKTWTQHMASKAAKETR